MKRIEAFFMGAIFGAVIGAVVALILAPQSGEELRARIGREAQVERERLRGGYDQARHRVETQIDTMRLRQDVDGESETAGEAAADG